MQDTEAEMQQVWPRWTRQKQKAKQLQRPKTTFAEDIAQTAFYRPDDEEDYERWTKDKAKSPMKKAYGEGDAQTSDKTNTSRYDNTM